MTKFWEEAEGQQSATRLIFILMSIYAMGMGAWVWAVTKDWTALAAVVPALFGLGAGLKLIQKPMEKEENKTP